MRDRRSLNRAMARLAAGDRAAFDDVFAAVAPPARALAARLLGDAADHRGADVEDAVQEAVIKIFARAHHYDPARDALTWALALVAWECRTVRRRQQRARSDGARALAELPDGERSPEALAIDHQLLTHVHEAIAGLSSHDQATIRAAWSGQPPDVPPATFRKRLERALARLRGAWSTTHGA